MVKDSGKSIKQSKGGKPKKDQGHEFRCIPKTVAGIFRGCLDTSPEKRALVDEMDFGVLSNIPNYYLKQKVLKELFNRFDIYDNTIHAVAGEVEITTKKIGDALGLSSTGIYITPFCFGIRFYINFKSDSLLFIEFSLLRCNKSGSTHPIGKPFPDKVVPKELSDEDHAVYKFFQGKTQAQLGRLIMDTPVDTVENKRLFMRAFLLFVQKTFLLATSSANVTPRAYPTFYDVENTKQRNWALHFGKNSREPIAQPPWIDYWNGRTLWDRMKQEKRDAAVSISETDTEGYVPDESEKDRDSEDTRSKELVQRKSRPEPNPTQEERRSKRRHESNDATEAQSGPDHEPPQQPHQLEEEETPIQQSEPQPQQQPQDDVIDLSSCSDDEQPPHHMDVMHPLVPKVEKLQEDQHPPVLEQPSQSVVEVVPIYPTQEVIDVSSGSEDERPPLIPKTEELDPYSPSAKIISEREEAPSFDLGIDPPLLTTQDLSYIEELDELVQKAKDQFQTPQPIKSLENQKELEEKAVAWATVPKGGNEFETIFKLAGDMFLEAMRYQFQSMAPKNYIDIQVRMFEKHGQSWMDTKNNRPHGIASLVNHEEYMVYLDKKKLLTH
ncbi:hypothetical protein PIB30_066470 [Stylosanthes scabra]|uniref:Uncharacterized protein n=1 Tax=Stylosanthes scabra TaxID=79078 RepID=A0ABU6VLR8_9FABA|nr:hypothetical protein [Stylosanthes scabra]